MRGEEVEEKEVVKDAVSTEHLSRCLYSSQGMAVLWRLIALSDEGIFVTQYLFETLFLSTATVYCHETMLTNVKKALDTRN